MRSLFQQPRRCTSVFFPDMGIFWTDVNFKYKGLVDFERSLTLVLFSSSPARYHCQLWRTALSALQHIKILSPVIEDFVAAIPSHLVLATHLVRCFSPKSEHIARSILTFYVC